jgi:uncharacterized protein YlxW (UPF0749 family)
MELTCLALILPTTPVALPRERNVAVRARLTDRSRTLSWLLVAFAFGILLSLQLNSLPSPAPAAPAEGRDHAAETIRRLETEQEALKARIGELRQELTGYQQETAATTALLEELNAELNRQKAMAGLVAVQGSGVAVKLDDSPRQSIPAGEDPSAYIVHEYDLRDVVNLLWMAGAEGIAVNEERVVGTSSVYCVGSTVMVNDTRLSPPYVIRAIGNPTRMEDYFQNPSYLAEVKEKARRNGLIFQVTHSTAVKLPAYQGSFALRYARTGQ